MLKKVGILANGGDVSGFNAVIRAIVKTAENHNIECYGIIDGYNGLIKKDFELLSTAEGGEAIGILPLGGSIIGSSTNSNLFNYKGYHTTSMHNYTEKYYARREIHTNMGSSRYYDVDDLNIPYNTSDERWSSDEDFMNQVINILGKYDEDDKFMTWLTTVTSHQPYGNSVYGNKYLYLFNDKKYENYNIKLKRYMSKLKVLDNGLGVLLEGLEKQNKLNDTVIILYGDHYPYGLSNNILEDALPYSIDEKYENERVPFVIWSSDIEPTIFEEYTSYVNILPTVANLFNLDFDSRYSTGQDLFSNQYEDLVVFADGSWKNKYAFYNASNGNITYYTNKEYSIKETIAINEKVNNKIKFSNLAIQHNYFAYLDSNLKK